MTAASTSRFSSGAPARPPLRTVAAATVAATVTLLALAALTTLSGHALLIPPIAASMALVAGAPSLPLAQPRSVIGGQLISACVGIGVGLVSHSLWAAAVAGGLALGAMLLARTSHSPAAATAAIGTTITEGQLSFILCAGIAAVVLVLSGLARSAFGKTKYPAYWW